MSSCLFKKKKSKKTNCFWIWIIFFLYFLIFCFNRQKETNPKILQYFQHIYFYSIHVFTISCYYKKFIIFLKKWAVYCRAYVQPFREILIQILKKEKKTFRCFIKYKFSNASAVTESIIILPWTSGITSSMYLSHILKHWSAII